jgi:hypothetical protein
MRLPFQNGGGGPALRRPNKLAGQGARGLHECAMPSRPLAPSQQRELAIGLARLGENFLDHAELIFRRVVAAAPGDPTASRYLGITLHKLGRPDEALALLRAAASADPAAAGDLAVAEASAEPTASFSTDRRTHGFRVVDYPYRAEVRYGEGRPPHPELAARIGDGRGRYAAFLGRLAEISADFADVPLGGTYDTPNPFWLNVWFPPLDGMALTQMLREHLPARFVEIGSGVSTKFARRAVDLYGLPTRLVSIDPQPRNEIDQLCDEVLRQPLEEAPAGVFQELEPGDILFLDSSHRAFQGSDVTVFFLEILPRLKPGVIVQVHDIYLPDDYISGHVHRLWNEQYLLATALLFGPERLEILFPSWFAGQDPDLRRLMGERVLKGPLARLNPYGASFWMRVL